MGSPANEPQRYDDQAQVRVTIPAPFAVGRFAVTFDEWDACVSDGGYNGYKPGDEGWGRGKHPLINVNWDDAKAYTTWLSRKTGKTYRLLSEAEREYVTRASSGSKGEYRRERTVPVDSLEANPWGLYNVHGNVWEWTEDCWNESNTGNTNDRRLQSPGGARRFRGLLSTVPPLSQPPRRDETGLVRLGPADLAHWC
jgi:formylglycine-generating enzyme required for sulfatase activity